MHSVAMGSTVCSNAYLSCTLSSAVEHVPVPQGSEFMSVGVDKCYGTTPAPFKDLVIDF
jgi:hypothetical protein